MAKKSYEEGGKTRGDFFLIDADRAVTAAKRSMNEGVAYLVLASGTAADNRTTKWSRTAVATYGGIGLENSKAAIDRLISTGDLCLTEDSTASKPKYRFPEIGERKTWLPCSLVDWGYTKPSLLKRIRQTGDPLVLALLLELYAVQNLAKDGGLPRTLSSAAYEKRKLGEFDEYDILAFGGHCTELSTKGQYPRIDALLGHTPSRPSTLFEIGALESDFYVFESDDPESEPVLPVEVTVCFNDLTSIAQERRRKLCEQILSGTSGEKRFKQAEQDGFVVFMLAKRHMKSLALRQILRLTHRAKTGNSARFVARDRELLEASWNEHEEIAERYKARNTKAPST